MCGLTKSREVQLSRHYRIVFENHQEACAHVLMCSRMAVYSTLIHEVFMETGLQRQRSHVAPCSIYTLSKLQESRDLKDQTLKHRAWPCSHVLEQKSASDILSVCTLVTRSQVASAVLKRMETWVFECSLPTQLLAGEHDSFAHSLPSTLSVLPTLLHSKHRHGRSQRLLKTHGHHPTEWPRLERQNAALPKPGHRVEL